jgi:hypothetical protein
MKKIIRNLATAFVILAFSSCSNELDTKPLVEQSFENLLQQDPNAAKGLLSRMYATFALTGSSGPGSSDIQTPDAGESGFIRGIINLQDFSADAMKNRWGDDGLDQLTTTSNWTPSNKFFRYLFDSMASQEQLI